MKKIIITIPAAALFTDAISLALFAAKMKEVVSETLFLKTLNEAIDVSLN